MILKEKNASLMSAQMRLPTYMWFGYIAVNIYFVWQLYLQTGSLFRPDFPVYDSSNTMMLPLTLCSIFNLLLAWILPRFILMKNPNLSLKYIAYILRLSLIGSIVIYGLVVAFAGHDGNLVLPFAIFALLGFIRSYPRPETFGFNLSI